MSTQVLINAILYWNICLCSDEGVHVSFDLSNPADMELKLENLTDKEMDELLKQAYKVNKDLKKELHRQERAQSGKSQTSKSKSKSKGLFTMLPSFSKTLVLSTYGTTPQVNLSHPVKFADF